jgi:hypothetical protein
MVRREDRASREQLVLHGRVEASLQEEVGGVRARDL